MSTSAAADVDDAICILNPFDDTSKGRRLIDGLSNERGESRIFGAYPRVAGSGGCAGGLQRLSTRADSAQRNEDHYYHQPSPPDPPRFGHGASSSGTEAESAAET
jgi:hypothetical protein